MEQTKHTPGPWEVVIGKECCFHDGNRVAVIKRTNEDGEEQEVTLAELWPASDNLDIIDARLIASAPELLESLKEAEFNVAKHAEDSLNGDVKIWLKQAQSVIAKAEGRKEK